MAGVIGHEIGHFVARYTVARISRAQGTQFGLVGLAILGGVAGLPSKTGQIADSPASLHLRGFSRDQEFEADAKASLLAQLRAHATLRAQISGDAPDAADSFDIMATHPRTLDSIKRATVSAGPVPNHARNLHRKAYQRAIDGKILAMTRISA